jgi:branched-subunit amino acid aminotransferase/4-amino-4-deoxychorismate lyase
LIHTLAAEVLAITSIDDRPVGNGRVGPITQRLYAEFVRRTRG